MIEFCRASSDDDLKLIAGVADEIWHECFPGIISEEQIDYMVEKFQSYGAMKRQISDEGYSYYAVKDGGDVCGYIALACRGDMLFLSKLYLLKSFRGRGYAGKMLAFADEECKKAGAKGVYLTVNKNNAAAIAVYKAKGYMVEREQKADIGNGFFMDDYVMAKML